jgi:hypothetical protein
MSFEFGRPLPAAEMRLKCCSTQVLDCKGVYCSAHNVAVPSGIRDSESVGPGRTRRRTRHGGGPDMAAAFLAPGVVAESAQEASQASSSSLAAPGPLSSLSSSPPAPASPSQPAPAPSPSSMSLPQYSAEALAPAAAAARAPAVQLVTIPRTNPVEDVPARHVKVHERIVGQIFLLDLGV